MLESIVAGLLRLGPWTAISAVLALTTGLAGSFWYSASAELTRVKTELSVSKSETKAAIAQTERVVKTLDDEIKWRDALTTRLDAFETAQAKIAKEVSDALDQEPSRPQCAISKSTADRVRASWAARAAAAKTTMQNPR